MQEPPVAGDDGEMSPRNDGGSAVPAEAETEWDQLGGRGQARDFAPIVELSSHTHSGRDVNIKMTPPVLQDRKEFPAFREQVKVYAKFNRFESVLTTESPVDVGSEERDLLLSLGEQYLQLPMIGTWEIGHSSRWPSNFRQTWGASAEARPRGSFGITLLNGIFPKQRDNK